MAAVASAPRQDAPKESNGEQSSEGGPSFTAVNGSNSPAPAHKVKDQSKESKEENRPLRPSSQNEQGRSSMGASQAQEQVSKSQQEKRPSPPQERAEDRPPPNYPHPHESIHDLQNNHSHTSSTPTQQNSNGVQKRKRSYPDDYDPPNNSTYHNHGLPPSPQRPRMYSQDNGPGRERDHATPDNHGRPERGNAPELYPRPERSPAPAENYPQPERHSLIRNEYDNRGDGVAPGRPYYSEARMAEALQRENNSYDVPIHENQFGSPEDDDEHQHSQQYSDYGGQPRSLAQRELDRTRRKRVFSNRTKTGCMTCRRRKKKCDEQHPECKSTIILSIFAYYSPSTSDASINPTCIICRQFAPLMMLLLESCSAPSSLSSFIESITSDLPR